MQLNSENSRRKLSISLTPLIDVVFILLLFFMLTSNFMPWRLIETNLPKQSASAADLEPIHTLLLKKNDGLIWYQEASFSLTDSKIIQEILVENKKAVFALQAESGVTLQTLISTADYLKLQGVQSISIANAFKVSNDNKVSSGDKESDDDKTKVSSDISSSSLPIKTGP